MSLNRWVVCSPVTWSFRSSIFRELGRERGARLKGREDILQTRVHKVTMAWLMIRLVTAWMLQSPTGNKNEVEK